MNNPMDKPHALTLSLRCGSPAVQGLQCYGCNIIQGQRYVDVGCSNPEVLTCSHSHKGFKHRFCIRTESSEYPDEER